MCRKEGAKMSFISEMIGIMVSYLMVIILAFFMIGFWFRGLFISFLKVKLSVGKLILVVVKSYTNNYYKAGQITDSLLRFKGRDKKKVSIQMPEQDCTYRLGTVNAINYDENTGLIMKPDLTGLETYDPHKMDSLYTRCLYQPTIFDSKEKIIVIMLALILIGMIILGYLDYQILKQMGALKTV